MTKVLRKQLEEVRETTARKMARIRETAGRETPDPFENLHKRLVDCPGFTEEIIGPSGSSRYAPWRRGRISKEPS
jgi:hypothetical protein